MLGAGQPLEEHDNVTVLSIISVVLAGESNMAGGTKRERERKDYKMRRKGEIEEKCELIRGEMEDEKKKDCNAIQYSLHV